MVIEAVIGFKYRECGFLVVPHACSCSQGVGMDAGKWWIIVTFVFWEFLCGGVYSLTVDRQCTTQPITLLDIQAALLTTDAANNDDVTTGLAIGDTGYEVARVITKYERPGNEGGWRVVIAKHDSIEGKTSIIAYKGNDASNVLDKLKSDLEDYGETEVFFAGKKTKVNKYIWLSFSRLYYQLEKFLFHPDRRYIFTGHSLGGAMASLLAIMTKSRNQGIPWHHPGTCLITFGQPRVGDKAYAVRHDELISPTRKLRFVNRYDIVPHIPTASVYQHHSREVWMNRAIGPEEWTPSKPASTTNNNIYNAGPHFTYWKLCGEKEPYYCSNREPPIKLDAHDHNLIRYRNQISNPPNTFFSISSTDRVFSWGTALDLSCPSGAEEVPFKLPRQNTKQIMHNFLYEEPLETAATPRSKHLISESSQTTPRSQLVRTEVTPRAVNQKLRRSTTPMLESRLPGEAASYMTDGTTPGLSWTFRYQGIPESEAELGQVETRQQSRSTAKSTIDQDTPKTTPWSESTAGMATRKYMHWTTLGSTSSSHSSTNENIDTPRVRPKSTARSTIVRDDASTTKLMDELSTESGRTISDSLIDKNNPLIENDEKYFQNPDKCVTCDITGGPSVLDTVTQGASVSNDINDGTPLPKAVRQVLSTYDTQSPTSSQNSDSLGWTQPSHKQYTARIALKDLNAPSHSTNRIPDSTYDVQSPTSSQNSDSFAWTQPSHKQYTATIAVKDLNAPSHSTNRIPERNMATISVTTDNAPPDRMEVGVPDKTSVSMVDNINTPQHTFKFYSPSAHTTQSSFTMVQPVKKPLANKRLENMASLAQYNSNHVRLWVPDVQDVTEIRNQPYPTNHIRTNTQNVNHMQPLPYPGTNSFDMRPLSSQASHGSMASNENQAHNKYITPSKLEEAARLFHPDVGFVNSLASSAHALQNGQPTARKAMALGLNVFTYTPEELAGRSTPSYENIGIATPQVSSRPRVNFERVATTQVSSSPLHENFKGTSTPHTNSKSVPAVMGIRNREGKVLTQKGERSTATNRFLTTHPMVKTYLDNVDTDSHPAVQSFLEQISNNVSPSDPQNNIHMKQYRSSSMRKTEPNHIPTQYTKGKFEDLSRKRPVGKMAFFLKEQTLNRRRDPEMRVYGSHIKPLSTPTLSKEISYGIDNDIMTQHIPTGAGAVKITTSPHSVVKTNPGGPRPSKRVGGAVGREIMLGEGIGREITTEDGKMRRDEGEKYVHRKKKVAEKNQMMANSEESKQLRDAPKIKDLFESTAVSWKPPNLDTDSESIGEPVGTPSYGLTREPVSEPVGTPSLAITKEEAPKFKFLPNVQHHQMKEYDYDATSLDDSQPQRESIQKSRNTTEKLKRHRNIPATHVGVARDSCVDQILTKSLDKFVTSKQCNDKQTYNNILQLLGPSEQDFKKANDQFTDSELLHQGSSFLGDLFKRGDISNGTHLHQNLSFTGRMKSPHNRHLNGTKA